MNSNIYAVIVTYNPELKNLNALITELKEQNCYVVVVDNRTNFTLKDKLADIEKVHLICLGRNEGIAKAQNIGIRYSLEKGAEKIIFLIKIAVFAMSLSKNFPAIWIMKMQK